MPHYQSAIFEEGTAHHLFLEFDITVATKVLPGLELHTTPIPHVHETFAFSDNALATVPHVSTPPDFQAFETIVGRDEKIAPSTQAHIFIWIHGNQRDEVFERGYAWGQALQPVAKLQREQHGFLYRDSRDLTGFIDGSANPKSDTRLDVALIPTGEQAGGSFVLAQRWLHNLPAFHALPVESQEQVIGRTKQTSIELDAEHMPPDSHVSRTDLKRHGQAVKIYRRSTPTGGITDPGLFFLAFSADLQRFHWLLDSMFGNADDGISDHLLAYSKPLSGSFYFAPNTQDLQRIFS